MFALGEDYDIEDVDGHNVFHVDGKPFRIRETFVIADRQGQEVATIKQNLLAFRKTMTIERGETTIATIDGVPPGARLALPFPTRPWLPCQRAVRPDSSCPA